MNKNKLILAGALLITLLLMAGPVLADTGCEQTGVPGVLICPISDPISVSPPFQEQPSGTIGAPLSGQPQSPGTPPHLVIPPNPGGSVIVPQLPQPIGVLPPLPSGGGSSTFGCWKKGIFKLINDDDISSINAGTASLTLSNLDVRVPAYALDIQNAFELRAQTITIHAATFFSDYAFKFLKENPDVSSLSNLRWILITVINLFISIFITISILKLLNSSLSSSSARAEQKQNLKRAVSLFIAIPASVFVYECVIAIVRALIIYILDHGAVQVNIVALAGAEPNLIVILFFMFSALLAYAGLAVRFVCMFAGALIIPLGILLYYSGVNFLTRLGSSIIMFVAGLTLVGVLDAIVLSVATKLAGYYAPIALLLVGVMTWSAAKKLFSASITPAYAAGRAISQSVVRVVKSL